MGALLTHHEVRFVRMLLWPGKRRQFRSSCKFKSQFTKTCQILDRELRHLGAKHIVIQLDCDESHIRNDGMPRSDARTISPGVILSFESKYGPLQYPCDTYGHWQENLRAIALALEALRMVDRYGVTQNAEQYRGWRAIQYRGDAFFKNADEAATWLAAIDPVKEAGITKQQIMGNHEAAHRAYKVAAASYHPDAGGDAGSFSRVTAAHEIIRGYHERHGNSLRSIGA